MTRCFAYGAGGEWCSVYVLGQAHLKVLGLTPTVPTFDCAPTLALLTLNGLPGDISILTLWTVGQRAWFEYGAAVVAYFKWPVEHVLERDLS